MKKTIYILAILIISTAIIQAEISEECFIEVRFYELVDDKYDDLGAVGYGMCKHENGIFYVSKNHVGITSGNINDNEDVLFEAHYDIQAFEKRGILTLYGAIYGILIETEDNLSTATKKLINQKFEYDNEIITRIGNLPSGNPVFIGITVTSHQIKSDDLNNSAITVKTIELKEGKVGGVVTNNKSILEQTNRFQTGFGHLRDGNPEQLKYKIKIKLKKLPEKILAPFNTVLTFERTYWIDTAYYSEKNFKPDFMYSSSYNKNVELVPGKILKLIFPPDTPSVHGFNIIDTVIISP